MRGLYCDVFALWCRFSRLPPATVTTGSAMVYGSFVRVSETNVHPLKLLLLAIWVSLALGVKFRPFMERCSASHLLECVTRRRNK